MSDTIKGAAAAGPAATVQDITGEVAAQVQSVGGQMESIGTGFSSLVAIIETDAKAVLDTLESMPAPTSLVHVVDDLAKLKALIAQVAQMGLDLATGLKAVAVGSAR
jgi:hypothetical protein